MKKFIVTSTENGMRLSRLVLLLTKNMPKSLLYKSFRNGRVKVFGKKKPENYTVCTGDEIAMYINDEFFEQKTRACNPATGFKTVYIDDNVAIVQKPQRMLCHSDATGDANLLDGFITAYGSGTFAPCLVNRIDRGTEGLVMIARTHDAAQILAQEIRERNVKKHYLAVTYGRADGECTTGFERVDKITSVTGGTTMKTVFETLSQKGNYYLVKAELITGKTHQIRAQLAHLGAPIVGDRKYGSKQKTDRHGQLLCAYSLTFGELPPPLEALSGRTFCCEDSETIRFFEGL